MPGSTRGTKAILLYDGSCGFCARSVQLVLRHEKRHDLRFAALESPAGRAIMARHAELGDVDSVVWFEAECGDTPERALVRSAAALEVAHYLGGFWRLAAVARLLTPRMRDRAYDFIARHRHRLGGTGAACFVPGPAHRDRFFPQAPE